MPGSTCVWIILSLLTIVPDQVQGVPCGYPGSSLNGRPNRVQEYYSEGQAVTYSCDQGYFLMGPATRKCTDNGTWTPSRIPLCDSRLGGLEEYGTVETSGSLHEYPPRLAIDGDPATCFYTGRALPRWWRIDLGRSYRILSVALTVSDPQSEHNLAVSVLSLNGNSAIYQRCGFFSGKFASSSLFMPCGGGGTAAEGGLYGRYLHIDDHRKDLNYFGLCEVDVLVLRDRYDCGQPERPVNSYTVRLRPDQVEYRCVAGHKLVGNRRRQCLTNGQWSGNQPLCLEVRCPQPDPIENGNVRVRSMATLAGGPQAVLGSLSVYTCDNGYTLKAAQGSGTNGSRICNEDGSWSPAEPPTCQPVDCGRPFLTSVFPEGTTLKPMNGSMTGQGAMARLRCPDGYEPSSGHDDLIRCRANGTWTKPKVKCLSGLNVASSPVEAAREEPGEAVTLGLVLGLVGTILLLTMVLAVLCLILRRQRSCILARPGRIFDPEECEAQPPPRPKRKSKTVNLIETKHETSTDRSPGAWRKLELRCLAERAAKLQLEEQTKHNKAPELGVETKPEARSETKTESSIGAVAKNELKTGLELKIGLNKEYESKIGTESKIEPETESKVEPETESKVEPESKVGPETESKVGPETESKVGPETESKAGPETESKAQPETETKREKKPYVYGEDDEPDNVVYLRLPPKAGTMPSRREIELNHAPDQTTKTESDMKKETEKDESQLKEDGKLKYNMKPGDKNEQKTVKFVTKLQASEETESESGETETESEDSEDTKPKTTNYSGSLNNPVKYKSNVKSKSESETESESESEDETQTSSQTPA